MWDHRSARLAICVAVIALGACVDAVPADSPGSATFTSGLSGLSTDYDQAGGASGAMQPTAGAMPAQSGGSAPPVAGGTMNAAGAAAPGGAAMTASGGGGMAGTMASVQAGSGASGNSMTGTGATGATGGSSAMGGSSALGGSPAMGGNEAPDSGAAGMLKVHFTSVRTGGRYAPANCGAVWVEDGGGKFIRTLNRWCGFRAYDLTAWGTASGGWPSFFVQGNAADQAAAQMDAISSATARSHVAHDATWDMKDLAGKLVADGKYTLRIEVTEGPSNSKSDAIEFQKGPMAQMIMAPDTVPYSGLTLNYQP